MNKLDDNPELLGDGYQETDDEVYWSNQGYIVEEVEDYLLREWKENQAFLGHNPYTDDELDMRSGKGTLERILNRSDAVMERAEGVRVNKDVFKLACARDSEERARLKQECDIPGYDGDDEFMPEWIPEFNPQGWLTENPITVKLGGDAAILRIAEIVSHRHDRRISIGISKDNGKFIRYTIGVKNGKIWISVASHNGRGVEFIPFQLTHFWLDVMDQNGNGVAILNAYRKVSGSKEYWLFQVSGINAILNIVVSIGTSGELYANMRADAKNDI